MKRYAFIDVQNTESTAERRLGFTIDWEKLCEYLKHKKSCVEVYLYSGIDNGDLEMAQEFEALAKTACCIVKTKPVFSYKNKQKIITQICECGKENTYTIETGYTRKSNCDVELSVDMIEKAGPDVEFYIFTGDGDFEYLIRKSLEKGVNRVYVYSYAEKTTKLGITLSRFSTKLRKLITERFDKVFYVSLRDIRDTIKKTLPR